NDRQKRRFQLPIFVLDRKVVLVMNQRCRQDLLGKDICELGGEGAGDHRRVLHQIGYLSKQTRIAVYCPTHARLQPQRFSIQLSGDFVMAFAALQNHEVLQQPCAVVIERSNLYGPSGAAAGGQEAMTVRDGSGGHVLHESCLRAGGPNNRKRHDPTAVQEENPTDGTAEQQVSAPVLECSVPSHQFWKGEPSQRAGEHAWKHVDGGLSTLTSAVREVLPLFHLHPIERRDLHTVL